MQDDDSFEYTLSCFHVESDKLQKTIKEELNSDAWSISEMIGVYFQVMSVSSHITLLNKYKESDRYDTSLSEKIQSIQKIITEEFNGMLHPRMMSQLSISIDDSIKKLQSKTQSSKKDIEDQARLYEELREKMSTKEFLVQYDRGLK